MRDDHFKMAYGKEGEVVNVTKRAKKKLQAAGIFFIDKFHKTYFTHWKVFSVHSSGKPSNIMFLHHKSVLPGFIQCLLSFLTL